MVARVTVQKTSDSQGALSLQEQEADQTAGALAAEFLPMFEETLRDAAAYALLTMGDEISAKAWMEYRIGRPMAELVKKLTDPGRRPGDFTSAVAELEAVSVQARALAEEGESRPPISTVRGPHPRKETSVEGMTEREEAAAEKAAAEKAAAEKAAAEAVASAARRAEARKKAAVSSRPALGGQGFGPPRPSSKSTPRAPSAAPTASLLQSSRRSESAPATAALRRKGDASPVPAIAAPPLTDLDAVFPSLAGRSEDLSLREPSGVFRPPPPPSFQPRSAVGSVRGTSVRDPRQTITAPPPDAGEEGTEARVSEGLSSVSPPPPSTRNRELETLIPPVTSLEADLFLPYRRRLQALNYAESDQEGALLLLELIVEAIPCRSGLIHRYDVNNSHFIVDAAVGEKASALDAFETPLSEPIIRATLEQRTPFHQLATAQDARFQKGRFAVVSPGRAVACAAGTHRGRPLGLIELIDPRESVEFTRAELTALADFASVYADFLAVRARV